MEKHHNRTFRCTTCSTTFESHSNLVSHLRTVHLNKDPHFEEGPLQNEHSKCHHCNFTTKNRVLLNEHIEQEHMGIKCTPCNIKFGNYDNLMNHMSEVHLTEHQRLGKGLDKYNDDKHPCRNGDSCIFHSQHRCMFFHDRPPQVQQRRQARQVPTDQWKTVPTRPQQQRHLQQGQHQQGHQQHQGRQGQIQGHKYWGKPKQNNTPWCQHGNNCPMGTYCVLRHNELDFPSLQTQSWQ